MHTTDLYFEAHVTIDPVFGKDLENLKLIASNETFRVAKLVLRKTSNSEEMHVDDSFMTARSDDYQNILNRTLAVVEALDADSRYNVRRYKIENTLLDRRR